MHDWLTKNGNALLAILKADEPEEDRKKHAWDFLAKGKQGGTGKLPHTKLGQSNGSSSPLPAAADDAPDNWEAWRSLKDPIPDYQQPALTEWKRTSEFSEITFSRYERLRLKDTLFCLCTCVVWNAFIGYLLFRFWFLRDLTSCLCVRDIALWIILTPFILIGFCLFVFMLKQILVPFTVQTIQLTRTEVSLGTSIFGLKQTKRFQY